MNTIKKEFKTTALLLEEIPSVTVMLFVVSVIITNLMAAKFIVNLSFVQVTGGLLMSWLPFLTMDIVAKHFGARAAIRLNIFGLIMYLCCVAVFELVTKIQYTPADPTADYSAFNSIYSAQWKVLVSSSAAFVVSGVVNAVLNVAIGGLFKKDNKLAYAVRCYVSTFIGQFVDNFIFVGLLNTFFSGFNWPLLPVLGAAALGGILELVSEVIFLPIGYRITVRWREKGVGKRYLELVGKRKNDPALIPQD